MIGKEQFYLDDEGYSGPNEDVCRLDVSMRQSRGMRMPAIIHKALLTISTKEIQYMFSKAPISQIPLLGNLLSDAVQTSHHWNMERSLGEPTTDCLTTMIPKDPTQDISITLWVGPERGDQMTNVFKLGPTWSSLPSHLWGLGL